MLKNEKGFHLFVVLLILFAVGILVFAGIKVFNNENKGSSGEPSGPNYQALEACGDKPLTSLPMDLSRMDQIAPLGNVDPPDHTLPTDHMYMMYPFGTSDQQDIKAPADVVVTGISFGSTYNNGTLESADYAISFYPCSELKLIFSHIDNLGEKLAAHVNPDQDSGDCDTSTQGTKEIKSCNWTLDVKLSEKDLVGTANGWDFWATYKGVVSPNIISPEYYHNVDAVCPLDYFTDNLQTQMYALVKRTKEPRCGEAYQDKANTLQGGWFKHKDSNEAKTDWSSHFSLVHHSVDTDFGLLATSDEDFMFRFSPRHLGTFNREPSETVVGTLYCYQHEGDQRLPNGAMAGTGKVLLRLDSNNEMKKEHKDGTCAASESFTNPETYYR